MSLAMDLAAMCDMWRWNGTNGCHLAVFNVDVGLARHFMASLYLYRSIRGIGYANKKLLNGRQFS